MGYRVRDYCPVGEVLPGMSYLVRRLLENTSNEGSCGQRLTRMSGRKRCCAILRKQRLHQVKAQDQEQRPQKMEEQCTTSKTSL